MTHIFFSFHFTHDYDRILKIMDIFTAMPGHSYTPFISDNEIERMKREGLDSIHQWIEEEIEKADAVVVLIGEHCFGRYFIDYEIATAKKLNKPLLGIYIDQIPDRHGNTGKRSQSPLQDIEIMDWNLHNGTQNLNRWIKELVLAV